MVLHIGRTQFEWGLLINGSLALIELHDRQGLDVDEALDRSLWAMRALIAAIRQATTLRLGEPS